VRCELHRHCGRVAIKGLVLPLVAICIEARLLEKNILSDGGWSVNVFVSRKTDTRQGHEEQIRDRCRVVDFSAASADVPALNGFRCIDVRVSRDFGIPADGLASD